MKHICLLLLMIGLAISSLSAQDRAPSPSSKTVQKVGLTDITVEYSRPSAKGRTIFAEDGLVPFGKKWRTGANSATKITFSDAVTIGGTELAAGSYAILTVPGATSWVVNFYPYDGTRWTGYEASEPSASVTTSPLSMDGSIESFMIAFDELKDYSVSMILGWEKTIVPISITVK